MTSVAPQLMHGYVKRNQLVRMKEDSGLQLLQMRNAYYCGRLEKSIRKADLRSSENTSRPTFGFPIFLNSSSMPNCSNKVDTDDPSDMHDPSNYKLRDEFSFLCE